MKVLVKLTIPSIGETYDVWIPDFVVVNEVVNMAARAVGILSDNRYVPSGTECLCLKKGSVVLRPDFRLMDYGIRHGDSLVLI